MSVNSDALKAALSTGMIAAIIMLLVELGRLGMAVFGALSMMAYSASHPNMPRIWQMPAVILGYAFTACGLIASLFILFALIRARGELDRL